MLAADRHQAILDLLNDHGSVSVTDMVSQFNVSDMTIRRDLDYLERKGFVRRVHGGAVIDRRRAYEPPFLVRAVLRQKEKERIGAAAAKLVKHGDSIALDAGTTTVEVARHLIDKQNITVITPCLQIANLLAGNTAIRLILSGGIVRQGELSLVGHLPERAFADFHVDKLFLAVAGVDFEAGLTEYNLEDTLVKQAMMRSAKEIILVVDATKFHQLAFATVAPLKLVNCVVTDDSVDTAIVNKLEKENIEVILA